MLTFASFSRLIFVLLSPLCWVLCLIKITKVSSIFFLLVEFCQISTRKYDFEVYKTFLMEKNEINNQKFENEIDF
jgi:hypothetical protein